MTDAASLAITKKAQNSKTNTMFCTKINSFDFEPDLLVEKHTLAIQSVENIL